MKRFSTTDYRLKSVTNKIRTRCFVFAKQCNSHYTERR